MLKYPLAEVFLYLTTAFSVLAAHYLQDGLGHFNNKIQNCMKDKAKTPLGVFIIFYDSAPVSACQMRLHDD